MTGRQAGEDQGWWHVGEIEVGMLTSVRDHFTDPDNNWVEPEEVVNRLNALEAEVTRLTEELEKARAWGEENCQEVLSAQEWARQEKADLDRLRARAEGEGEAGDTMTGRQTGEEQGRWEIVIEGDADGGHWFFRRDDGRELHNFGEIQSALDALEAEVKRLRDGAIKQAHEIEQILGKALGYPWYKDDPKSFPDATEADGVCVGDHVPESLAAEAADRIDRLRARAELADRYRERIARDVQHALTHDYEPSLGLFMEDFAADYDALSSSSQETGGSDANRPS